MPWVGVGAEVGRAVTDAKMQMRLTGGTDFTRRTDALAFRHGVTVVNGDRRHVLKDGIQGFTGSGVEAGIDNQRGIAVIIFADDLAGMWRVDWLVTDTYIPWPRGNCRGAGNNAASTASDRRPDW